jgi:transcription initiation factor TFIIB
MVLEEKPEIYMTIEAARKKIIYDHLPKPRPINLQEATLSDPFKSGCPECKVSGKSIVRDYDNGEIYCKDCGFVIYSEMDRGPEWRAYDSKQSKERPRAGIVSPLLHDKGLGSIIPVKNIDFYGKKINQQEAVNTLNRLRKWNVRSRVNGPVERSIIYNNNEIDMTCQGLECRIPKSTQETAVSIMAKATKGEIVDGKRKSIIRGRSRKALSKAATLIASRKSGLAVTLDDIADESVSRKELANAYRVLVNSGVRSAVQKYEPLIKRYVNNLWGDNPKVSSEVELTTLKILEGASSNEREDGKRGAPLISGKGPSGMAAAMTYIAGILRGQKQTQKDIAEAASVTEVTVRNRYKDILRNLMIEYQI